MTPAATDPVKPEGMPMRSCAQAGLDNRALKASAQTPAHEKPAFGERNMEPPENGWAESIGATSAAIVGMT
ncbi:hypothetical protein GCM10007935_15720 [Hydrogenophaga electricum]|uniref:Uncharacterized protein n=1 Tax=Hydrogenophaga electricum TaxID=1230953 RepID=A0ABQ6C1D8_9BURK|nr:hypothetical protein GCM10007935_15720 [Hydrogenophaga electricum]